MKNMTRRDKNVAVGNLVFKDNILSGSEIIFDYQVEFVKDLSLSEADIDSKTSRILTALGWIEEKEFRQNKTDIPEIDDYIKSKSNLAKRKGHADFYILVNDKLKVIIDNKKPKQSIQQGIEDAKFYADCLLEKNYDIRIAMAYNGRNCIVRVYNTKEKKWKPFLIDGDELKAFPSKELVNLIYRFKDMEGIKITEEHEPINISKVINRLKEIYRKVAFLQNDNQKTIDFTISFIALKLILEKHSSELGKNWTDFDVSEQKKIKEKIKAAVEDIIDNLQNGYEEIFKIKEDKTGKIKAFDFLDVIKQFPNRPTLGKGNLIKIFEAVDSLPHLHSSKFDIFSEIYQSLMDKYTRKIFGQFFTPRHLIKTIIRLFYEDEIPRIIGDIVNNKSEKPKTICDPACGTGGFLTESFKYMATNVNDVDVIDFAKRSFYGFDIYPANAVRSRINMYLAGDGFSIIEELDTLHYDDLQFDYILTNPPFGKGDFNVDPSIMSNKRLDINFLIKVVKLLKDDGKALIIMPDGILEATTLYPLRNWLVKNCKIEKIISLPKHEFAPYTHEKTNVLILKKRVTPIENLKEIETERIWMYIIDCDGYANSDKRFRTNKTDKENKWLHDELSVWRNHKGAFHISLLEECWKRKSQNPNEEYTDEWGTIMPDEKYGYVKMSQILKEEYSFYPIINKTKIVNLLKKEEDVAKPNNSNDLFEEGEEDTILELKEEYAQLLEEKKIEYNEYNGKFYDTNNPKIKKLVTLLPEKYLRSAVIETVEFQKFKEENDKIIKKMKEGLKQIGGKVK